MFRNRTTKEWVRLGTVAAIILAIAGFSIAFWYNATHLLVTTTRPSNNKVAPAATDIVFWFNKQISADTAKNISISPSFPGKATVDGNALTFSPNAPLAEGQKYTVTVSGADSKDGKYHAGENKITFTIGYVPYDQQSDAAKRRGLEFTDNQPPQLVFFGDDELTKQGVTTDQLTNMENFMTTIFNKSKKTDYVINIDNVTAEPFDSQAENPVQTFTFDMEMNDATYKARFDCSVFGSAHLYVYDGSGKLVWDSGKLGNDNFS